MKLEFSGWILEKCPNITFN